ncbi:MAG: amidophosphoribosyltransferase [Candidatus Thermoplasmatota archaeon]|nr:amidophosphoribosyltransferase [Candidatus Thermoplasmatota archaeon]
MCGIVGIITRNENVSYSIYRALVALQHRGQSASGIATFDGEEITLRKGPGLVNEVFDRSALEDLWGNVGIGHVRYPTAGTDGVKDAQPFITNIPQTFALVENGNLTNDARIRELLRERGRIVRSTSDGESVLKLFASSYRSDPFEALEGVMSVAEGSYSVIVLTTEGLIAFRDPYAIRPLALGYREGSYMFASETAALDVLGYKKIRDLDAGEAVFVDRELNIDSRVLNKKGINHCMFEWVYFGRADSVIDGISVYEARLNLGRELAELFDKNVDIVMPVPDTSIPAAISFSEEKGLRYREGVMKNRYIGRTFIMESQSKRENAVRDKLNPMRSEVNGRRVAMIDDSIVRGTTSREIVEMLKKEGAKEVHLLSTCPPIKYPCVYGIDFSTRGELIAGEKGVEEIRREIGCDSLTYQSLEGLSRAIGSKQLCTACLSGEYPTGITHEEIRMLGAKRAHLA